MLSPPDPLARRANLYPANALGVNPPVMVSELVGVGLFTSPSETELRREIGPLTVRIGGGISVGMGLAGRIGLVWSCSDDSYDCDKGMLVRFGRVTAVRLFHAKEYLI